MPTTTITDHLLIDASVIYTPIQGDTSVNTELKIINDSILSVLGGSITVDQVQGWDNILIGNNNATSVLLIDGGDFIQSANRNFVIANNQWGKATFEVKDGTILGTTAKRSPNFCYDSICWAQEHVLHSAAVYHSASVKNVILFLSILVTCVVSHTMVHLLVISGMSVT